LAFVGWTVQGMDVTNMKAPKGSGNLVNISVSSAALDNAVNASIHIYSHTAPLPLPLPINTASLKNLVYAELITDAVKNNTIDPTFNATLALNDAFFNDNSFVAVEIWDNVSPQVSKYIGGVELPVGHVKQMPHQVRIRAVNQTSQLVGSLAIEWN